MTETTLCYITVGDRILMLHRVKKDRDENAGKYIGLGGHMEKGESPEECMLREIREESGITLSDYAARGTVLFYSDVYEDEIMHLFTGSYPSLPDFECSEGNLCLVDRDALFDLNLWEGDRIFLYLLFENAPFFKLELHYEKERLVSAILNGEPIKPEDFTYRHDHQPS